MLRRIILAATLLYSSLALAQAPPAVPALPDTERRTSYTLSGTSCACAVNFAIYGDGTDIDNWIQVWINGVRKLSTDPTSGWTLSSPTGALATIPRPINDAVLTFNAPQTGTVQIVGARRPRQLSQFSENRGVAARDLNQRLTDLTAIERELWDKTNDLSGRGLFTQPGNTMGPLPLPSSCINNALGFGPDGLTPTCFTPSTAAAPLVVGTTMISNGTTRNVLYNAAGILGQLAITGTANTLATFTGSLTSGDCISVDGGSNLTDFGGACVSPGSTTTLTNKTYDTGGAGNVLKIGGHQVSAVSGSTATLATSIGTLTNGHCVSIDASGNLIDAGAACAAGSGSGTVNAGTAGQLAYYVTSTNAVSGNANLTVSSGAFTIGVAGSQAGTVLLSGATSGTTTLASAAAASGTLTVPAATDTLVARATTDTLTNKTYDTAGTGNVFKINGTQITAIAGNTGTVGTTSGTFVSGNCVKTDANHNIIDQGAACGTSTPGGSNTQVQFNNSGVFGGDAGMTYAGNGQLTLALGSISANLTALDITATWTGGGFFNAPFIINITNTSSAGNSNLVNWQASGTSTFISGVAGQTILGLGASQSADWSGMGGTIPMFGVIAGQTGAPVTTGAAFVRYGNVQAGFAIDWAKSRGSIGSRVALSNGDIIYRIAGWGDDGTSFKASSDILVTVAGTVSAGIVPTRLTFKSTNTSGALTTALTMNPSGGLVVGNVGGSLADQGVNTLNALGLYVANVALPGGLLYSAAGTALPACSAGLTGFLASVSDATAPTYGGNYVSGGGAVATVVCNGANWTTQ
jgi:hypothetical protein